jgi:preprotein translocase subunit SecB
MTPEQLQEAINFRQTEINNYQVNIDNYGAMINMLPAVCPDHLKPFVNEDIKSLTNALTFEDIQLLSDFKFRKQLEQALITEKLEQRKSQLVLQALTMRNA